MTATHNVVSSIKKIIIACDDGEGNETNVIFNIPKERSHLAEISIDRYSDVQAIRPRTEDYLIGYNVPGAQTVNIKADFFEMIVTRTASDQSIAENDLLSILEG